MLRVKRKKRKGKGKKVKKKCVDERETLTYEQEILDNNRQLARLRSRNQELEEAAEQVKEKFRQLEEDRSDVIAHLKRNLEEKIEESKELAERLSAVEELRKDELATYKKKEEAMQLEYRTMENNLSAEVKLAAGKLNALEDWRLARIDLMQKFEMQEKEIIEQEKRHREELYEAEKSVIIGKAMMKKEMEERLDTLAMSLRKATNMRVAEATHRAIRENMTLNQELDMLEGTCRELGMTSKESKEAERIWRLQCELFETESNMTLEMAMKQRNTIHKLTDDFQSMLWYYGQAERDNARIAEYEKIVENYKEQVKRMEEKMEHLKKCILKTRADREKLSLNVREREKELDALKSLLNRARSCIKEALELEGDITRENYCASHLKQQLLQCLWEILESDNITSIIGQTASQIEDINCRYTQGNLGLMEPTKTCKCEWKEETEENIQEYSTEAESFENFEEKRPSCLDSDISSNIQSPKESLTDSQL
ncbi:golgin subfamily A member 4-like isoform X1 [Hylaeus volcanicus]|uniref:golgin subfamily A member 4-like isoform X1 n=2 Tax=Hylaeus volcanicus TaxID=313075 RepID=UPI0023B82092|nr:golgin subfamily A member 4-like isoform X1 [Hylaeus volcanicus]